MIACMELRPQHPNPKPAWRRAGGRITATVVARIRIYVPRSWDSGLWVLARRKTRWGSTTCATTRVPAARLHGSYRANLLRAKTDHCHPQP